MEQIIAAQEGWMVAIPVEAERRGPRTEAHFELHPIIAWVIDTEDVWVIQPMLADGRKLGEPWSYAIRQPGNMYYVDADLPALHHGEALQLMLDRKRQRE